MNVDISFAMVFIGTMVFLAHLFTSLYTRKMIPDVLLLILIGVLIGPVLGLVSPSDLGGFGPVFTTITLAIILFECGTTMSIAQLKSAWKSTMKLCLTGFIVSVTLVTLISVLFMGFSLNSGIMFGAILGGTSSAVVIPVVKQLQMGESSRTALVLESAITDVLCIVLALACLQAFQSGGMNLGHIFGNIISSFVLAAFIGVVGAMIWSRILTKMRTIQNSIFTTPSFVFIIYGATELLGFSGAIAALSFGVTMANIDRLTGFVVRKIMGGEGHKFNDTELIFIREIAFLLKTFFFVYIGISILFEDFYAILMGMVITAVLYIARLFVAKVAAPEDAKMYDKSVISMMTPKGLAAAVLATIPETMGVPEGAMIKNVTYAVVFISILLTSILILLNDKSNILKGFYSRFYSGFWKKRPKGSESIDIVNTDASIAKTDTELLNQEFENLNKEK